MWHYQETKHTDIASVNTIEIKQTNKSKKCKHKDTNKTRITIVIQTAKATAIVTAAMVTAGA